MRYRSPAALRMALGQLLRNKSQDSGISLDRLRRRVMYERIVVRLDLAEPDTWVVKGGLALEFGWVVGHEHLWTSILASEKTP